MFMDFFIRWRRGFLLSYNYFIKIYIYIYIPRNFSGVLIKALPLFILIKTLKTLRLSSLSLSEKCLKQENQQENNHRPPFDVRSIFTTVLYSTSWQGYQLNRS